MNEIVFKDQLAVPIEKYEKLYKTLEEIREMAQITQKDICAYCGRQDSDCCEPQNYTCSEFIQILDKINEVLNDRD